MAMGIAACGNQSESNKEAKKDDNTITVWCWDKTFNIFAMEEAAKIYQEDHQDVKIDIVEVGDVWNAYVAPPPRGGPRSRSGRSPPPPPPSPLPPSRR